MEKTTLYLPTEVQRALRELSRRRHQPQAVLIREALQGYLSKQQPARLKSLGLGTDDKVTGSSSEGYLRRRWRAK